MYKKSILSCLAAGAFFTFLPSDLVAQTASELASQEFLNQTGAIQAFLFGPAMRIAGVLGGAYGLMQAILSSSLKPLVIFGGIGLAVNLIPQFINGVFVSGMLLP